SVPTDQANGAATTCRGQFCIAMSRAFASSDIPISWICAPPKACGKETARAQFLLTRSVCHSLVCPIIPHLSKHPARATARRLPPSVKSTAVIAPLAPAPLLGLHYYEGPPFCGASDFRPRGRTVREL